MDHIPTHFFQDLVFNIKVVLELVSFLNEFKYNCFEIFDFRL
jgi:hypothetical protein